MNLVLVAPPDIEPVSLDEAKLHLKVDISNDDALISSLITSARRSAEIATGRALITQQWEMGLDKFPADLITVPLGNLQTIDSIAYIDTDGASQTVDSIDYAVDTRSEPASIRPSYDGSWPTTRDQTDNAVIVQFTCGYGDNASDVPDGLRAAI